MAEYDIGDFSESAIYNAYRIVLEREGAPLADPYKGAWTEKDRWLYNHLRDGYLEAEKRGLVFDPVGVGLD